ncbi:hypothetical protein M218_04475 [Burkholderia pseudomallei MSHR338]|nr:hypothetical protein M218_04475 [Burkholderia pseudomallei MSHR338]
MVKVFTPFLLKEIGQVRRELVLLKGRLLTDTFI